MSDNGTAAIAKAVSGKVPRLPSRGGGTTTIYVEVEPTLETEAGDPIEADREQADLVKLQSGERYRVWITLFKAPAGGERTIPVRGSTAFWLTWSGVPGVTLSSDLRHVTVDQLESDGLALEFALEIAPSVPITSGKLNLHYASGSKGSSLLLLEVAIRGRHHALPSELEPILTMQLDEVYDPKFAYVHVSCAGEELGVVGYHSTVGRLNAGLPQPSMSLADVDDEQPSRLVYEIVDDYSRKSAGKLTHWINTVLKQVREDLHADPAFVIVEHADSRVPWEMLTLDREGRVFGERALVTRWTPLQLYDRPVRYEPGSIAIHKGRVLKFLDRDHLHGEGEAKELSQCAAVHCDELKHLTESLEQLPDDIALVFLGCHGALAIDDAHRVELQALKNPSGKVTTLNLARLVPPKRPPAMVINACHSARLARGERGIEGFPELFLARFARSFFGTLGAVDDKVAGTVGAELLQAARKSGGVQIAAFLHQLRQRAVLELKHEKSAKKFRNYVSYFMYVLYGSAWDRIELDPAGPAPPKGKGKGKGE